MNIQQLKIDARLAMLPEPELLGMGRYVVVDIPGFRQFQGRTAIEAMMYAHEWILGFSKGAAYVATRDNGWEHFV